MNIPVLINSLTILVVTISARHVASQELHNPLTMNGGSVLAMAGKDCVAVAVDKRFANGNQMVSIGPRQVFVPSPHLMIAFTGLEGDVQSLAQEVSKEVASKLRRSSGLMNENRLQRALISPRAMASLTSHLLYSRKQAPYFAEPLVVGLTNVDTREEDMLLSKQNIPFLCSIDNFGAKSVSQAFVCGGAASGSIFGTAEALWKQDLTEKELVHVCSNAFLSALERDCLSGLGAILYLITRDGITEYDLASRND